VRPTHLLDVELRRTLGLEDPAEEAAPALAPVAALIRR
jgi:hypothetical protein